jgi:hypothetical protein
VFVFALALGPETVAREGVRLAAFARFVGWERQVGCWGGGVGCENSELRSYDLYITAGDR